MVLPRPDPRDPVARVEREALECVLQVPHLVGAVEFDELGSEAFTVPAFRAVHDAVRAAGGLAAAGEPGWAERVRDAAAGPVAPLVTELAVAPLMTDSEAALARYAGAMLARVGELAVTRRIADLRSRLQRLDAAADPEGYRRAFAELLELEGRRRVLRERAAGAP